MMLSRTAWSVRAASTHVPQSLSKRGIKILCALYPDPAEGFPPKYARHDIPIITKYANGQTAPTPKAIDFKPSDLLGCVSGALGLRPYLESKGVNYVVTSDKVRPRGWGRESGGNEGRITSRTSCQRGGGGGGCY
jgi:hypothetical protein